MAFGWQVAAFSAFTTLTTVAAITVTAAALARLALLAVFRRIVLAFRTRLHVVEADSWCTCCHHGKGCGVKVFDLRRCSGC